MQTAFYKILRIYVRIGLAFFFRKFTWTKHPDFKETGSVIFAANHQNAFMDALAIVMSQKRLSYFLTRAEVFQSKFGAAFFGYIHMMPIYRQRDGVNTVKKNTKIIANCVDYLIKGEQPLTIYPEGNHNLRRSIRPLKKGIARIAFGVLDKNPDIDLKIVPIGINYSAHKRFRSDLHVVYGEPIVVKPYYKNYLANNNQGYEELLTELENRMKLITIDMPRGLKYHPIAKKWVANSNGTFDLDYNFKKNKELVDIITNEKEIPKREVSDTSKILKILFSPLWLIMFVINFIPFKVVHTLTKKLASDPSFTSSMNLVFGIFVSLFFFLIEALILWAFVPGEIALIFFFSVPPLNFLLFKIYKNHYIVE